MAFIKDSANKKPIIDNVFSTVALCKKDISENGSENVINGTIGSLCDEDGKLVAYDAIFDHYKQLDYQTYASYASGFAGNKDFIEAFRNWIIQDKINDDVYKSCVATSGGTGAVSVTIQTMLDAHDTLLIPDLAWESYELMAAQFNLQLETYQNFKGNSFDLADFYEKCTRIMERQHRLLVIINDPAHNPSGYSLTDDEWKQIIDMLNEFAASGPVTLLNDIAYIDYCKDVANSRNYMTHFNDIANNIAIVIAASLSKTASSYGMRLGAAIILSKQEDIVQQIDDSFKKYARSIWSNVNNSAMVNWTWVLNNAKDQFISEKQKYVDLLAQRADLFLQQANAVKLPLFPFKEGFFVTIDCHNNETRDKLFDLCVANHIYICKVNNGLRVALCSLPLKKIDGLADKLIVLYQKASD